MQRNTYQIRLAAKAVAFSAYSVLFYAHLEPVLWATVIVAAVGLAIGWRSISTAMRGDE